MFMKLKKCIREGKRKIGLIMSIMILITMVMPSSMTYAAQRVAKVESMQGEVTVYKSGQEKEYKGFKGMSLSEGDRIETGKKSWVLLGIDKDKGVKIGDNTTINISELKDLGEGNSTQFQVLKGKVWNEVKEKLNSNSKYEIKTPTAVMGVRGTEFFVSYENGILKVGVIEGEVGVAIYEFEKDKEGEWKLKDEKYILKAPEYLYYDEISKQTIQSEIKPEELDRFLLEMLLENRDKLPASLVKKVEDALKNFKEKEELEEQKNNTASIEEQVIVYETEPEPERRSSSSSSSRNPLDVAMDSLAPTTYTTGSSIVLKLPMSYEANNNIEVSWSVRNEDQQNMLVESSGVVTGNGEYSYMQYDLMYRIGAYSYFDLTTTLGSETRSQSYKVEVISGSPYPTLKVTKQ